MIIKQDSSTLTNISALSRTHKTQQKKKKIKILFILSKPMKIRERTDNGRCKH